MVGGKDECHPFPQSCSPDTLPLWPTDSWEGFSGTRREREGHTPSPLELVSVGRYSLWEVGMEDGIQKHSGQRKGTLEGRSGLCMGRDAKQHAREFMSVDGVGLGIITAD